MPVSMVIYVSEVVPMDISSFENCEAYSFRGAVNLDLMLGLSVWQGGLKVSSYTYSAIIF